MTHIEEALSPTDEKERTPMRTRKAFCKTGNTSDEGKRGESLSKNLTKGWNHRKEGTSTGKLKC